MSEVKALLIMIVFFGVLILGVLVCNVVVTAWQCPQRFPDVEARYVPFVGCQVNTEQGWIPADNFRVID